MPRWTPAEEENLEADYQRSSNAARLLELCQGALQLVSENEGSLLDRSGDLGRVLAICSRSMTAPPDWWNCTRKPAPIYRNFKVP